MNSSVRIRISPLLHIGISVEIKTRIASSVDPDEMAHYIWSFTACIHYGNTRIQIY